jgi:hypothetical protein
MGARGPAQQLTRPARELRATSTASTDPRPHPQRGPWGAVRTVPVGDAGGCQAPVPGRGRRGPCGSCHGGVGHAEHGVQLRGEDDRPSPSPTVAPSGNADARSDDSEPTIALDARTGAVVLGRRRRQVQRRLAARRAGATDETRPSPRVHAPRRHRHCDLEWRRNTHRHCTTSPGPRCHELPWCQDGVTDARTPPPGSGGVRTMTASTGC